MTCRFCKHPLSYLSSKVAYTEKGGVRIERIRCSTCGATYRVEEYLEGKPTVTPEFLERYINRPS